MDDLTPEIELIEPDDVDGVSNHGSPRLRAGILGALLLMAGIAIGSFVASDDDRGGEALPSTTTTTLPPSISTSVPPPATPASTTLAATTPPEAPTVRLLPGSIHLQGRVALANTSDTRARRMLWMVDAGRLRSRSDVPLAPGVFPYPLILSDQYLAFTSSPQGYLLGTDLGDPAIGVGPARYLIPSAAPDGAYAIDDDITTLTPIGLTDGTTGEVLSIADGIDWIIAAVGDGFLVVPSDRSEVAVAHWVPGASLQPLAEPVPGQSGAHAAAGTTVVMVSPGPLISAIDIDTGQTIEVEIDIGEGLVSDVCLSPEQSMAVVVGSTGTSVLIDFESARVVAELSVTEEFESVAWTSHDQIVFISEGLLLAYNVRTEATHGVADLGAHSSWWITGSGTVC